MAPKALIGLALGLALAVGGWVGWRSQSGPEAGAYSAPGLEPMTAEVAAQEIYVSLLPALLIVVYEAFAQTEEQVIYDTLASATGGEALEALYLERAGAMVGGGLTETDQTIHEMRLIAADARRDGEVFDVSATWEVIGTVGHSEHLHVRGNIYSADLVVAPVGEAWKITGFTLLDVDRGAAGEMFEVVE